MDHREPRALRLDHDPALFLEGAEGYCQLDKTGFGECSLGGVSESLNPAGWPLSSADPEKLVSLTILATRL